MAYPLRVGRIEVLVGIAVTVLWVYSIVNCVLTPDSAVRGIPKAAWLVVIVLLPLLGSVLWLGVGRSAPRPPQPGTAVSSPRGYSAMASDERIRRMEEDLARLEQEDRRNDDQEPRPGRA